MRARYYSPALRRFINADIIPGEISNAVTLNRYAYANGNPVSNVDPFGLVAVGVLALIWIIGNNISSVGVEDDVAIIPTINAIEEGSQLLLG